MPNNRINDFIQDSRGYYWIATEGTGLVRFDGYEFRTYPESSKPSRLFVSSLTEDEDGRIWAGLENSIMSFDGYTFKEFPLPVESERVKRIAIASGGEVLVLSNRGKLRTFAAGEWQNIGDPEVYINDISSGSDGIWLGSRQGLFRLKGSGIEFIDSGIVVSLAAGQKNIRVAFEDGSRTYNLKGKLISRSENKFRYMFIGNGREIALTLAGDLVVFTGNRQLRLDQSNGFFEQDYRGCYADDAGVIWSYSNKGLVKLESLAWRFYRGFEGVPTTVSAVYMNETGDVYAGLKNGLIKLETNGSGKKDQKYLPFGLTLALEEYQGSIWAGTEKGLVKFNPKGGHEMVSGSGFIFAMHAMDNILYLGSDRGLLEFRNGRFHNIITSEATAPPSVYGFSRGSDNSLWAGTYFQGFYVKSDEGWQVKKELHGQRVDSLRFSCFAAVSEAEIWAGSLSDGIYHFSEDKMEHITAAELDFAEIESMSIGKDGTVWAGTNKGLVEIRKGNTRNMVKLYSGAGFQGSSCTPQALMISYGLLATGTIDGLQLLDIENYRSPRPEPRIAITDMKMFLEHDHVIREYANDSLPFSFIPSGVELPHYLNFLSFDLAGLSGYQQNKLQYRYRLLGQSDEWTYAAERREAIFSNIKPGQYTFQAQVARFGESWSSHQLEYSFSILRPLWLRWWFISIAILLTGSLIFLFVRDRLKRLNQRLRLENALLDMERKALRLQMNPHFIFNALDSISSFIFKKDPEKAVRYLNNFAKLMRLTLESSMEHLHPVETEVSILKNYLELEKLRFQGKFEYSIEVDDEIDYDVGIPPMLIQPHVENAILHGLKPKQTTGILNIRFKLEDDLLIVEVEDDGIGRKASREMKKRKDHRSMATRINRDRLRLLKLSMSEKVEINIIDKEDAGEARGTTVIIKLPAEEI